MGKYTDDPREELTVSDIVVSIITIGLIYGIIRLIVYLILLFN